MAAITAPDSSVLERFHHSSSPSPLRCHPARPRQLQLGDLHPQESRRKTEEAGGFDDRPDAAAGNNGSIDDCEQHSGGRQCGEDTAMAVDDDQGCHTPKFKASRIQMLQCPPAPRKRRATVARTAPRRIDYFIIHDFDAFFPHRDSSKLLQA